MAQRFFYVSLGILALTIAFHLGARSAKAGSQEVLAVRIVGIDFAPATFPDPVPIALKGSIPVSIVDVEGSIYTPLPVRMKD
jgi:hypothetical protein